MRLRKCWITLRVDPSPHDHSYFLLGDTIKGVCTIHGQPIPEKINLSFIGSCEILYQDMFYEDKHGRHILSDGYFAKDTEFLRSSILLEVVGSSPVDQKEYLRATSTGEKAKSLKEFGDFQDTFVETVEIKHGEGAEKKTGAAEVPFEMRIPETLHSSNLKSWRSIPLPPTYRAKGVRIKYILEASAHGSPLILGRWLSTVKGESQEITILHNRSVGSVTKKLAAPRTVSRLSVFYDHVSTYPGWIFRKIPDVPIVKVPLKIVVQRTTDVLPVGSRLSDYINIYIKHLGPQSDPQCEISCYKLRIDTHTCAIRTVGRNSDRVVRTILLDDSRSSQSLRPFLPIQNNGMFNNVTALIDGFYVPKWFFISLDIPSVQVCHMLITSCKIRIREPGALPDISRFKFAIRFETRYRYKGEPSV